MPHWSQTASNDARASFSEKPPDSPTQPCQAQEPRWRSQVEVVPPPAWISRVEVQPPPAWQGAVNVEPPAAHKVQDTAS